MDFDLVSNHVSLFKLTATLMYKAQIGRNLRPALDCDGFIIRMKRKRLNLSSLR